MVDDSVRQAMDRWPDVPAAYGWLGLDERGRWRLQDDPIAHPGLIAFINRNYGCDEAGRWFFQNGPQRVYVRLAYTPWVLYVDGGGGLRTHTDRGVDALRGALVDDEDNLLLDTDAGLGLVHADALPAVAEWLVDAAGHPADAERMADALGRGAPSGLCLRFGDTALPVGTARRAEVPARFGFVAEPQPPAGA